MQPLEESTRSKLRSTQILTSLPQIISELVQNALDAKARQVEVGVNPDEWSCWVRDDGTGISRDGMALLGQGYVKGRYVSSKAHTLMSIDEIDTFGFRGEALASAADLSCVEISSRTTTSGGTWSVIIKGQKQIHSGPAIRWRRDKPGTVVCIRDAFYNLPIRRLSHPTPQRTVEVIRHDLEKICLVFPQVAFSLEQTGGDCRGSVTKTRVLTISQSASSLSAFQQIHGKALVEHVDEINISQDDLRIQGFISLEGHISKAYQYLYVNRHPLDLCDLHRAIDSCFSKSSFGRNALDPMGAGKSHPASRRSPQKVEYKAVYCLNMSLPQKTLDVCLEPSKATVHFEKANNVRDFLVATIDSFLVRNGFSASQSLRMEKTCSIDDTPLPRKRPSPRKRSRADDTSGTGVDLVTWSLVTSLDTPQIHRGISTQGLAHPKEGTCWCDPATGERFPVGSHAGNSNLLGREVLQNFEDHSIGNLVASGMSTSSYVDKRWLRRDHLHGQYRATESPNWIQSTLKGCAHSSFQPVEPGAEPIPVHLSHEAEAISSACSRFTKGDLLNMSVVGQVDRKFIACLTQQSVGTLGRNPPSSNSIRSLVLVDQHAADERVRVEGLLRDLTFGVLSPQGVAQSILSYPLQVLLTQKEARMIFHKPEHLAELRQWGFVLSAVQSMPDGEGREEDAPKEDCSQVSIEAVPEVLIEKFKRGNTLRDILKSFVAKWECGEDFEPLSPGHEDQYMSDHYVGTAPSLRGELSWLKVLRKCPPLLLDLINSKACRGAIMFNDLLDHDQCQRLIQQLTETVFPFQCAHGRPSFVPLVPLESDHPTFAMFSPFGRKAVDWTRLAAIAPH